MDPGLNQAPDHIQHIHIIGICGTGMGALAGMLKQAGYKITGSDQQVYPPMSTFLADLNIPVAQGYNAENLAPRPDLVVVGNVITKKNPEAIALASLGVPYLSFPQTLAHFFLKDNISLVACGTHGKTTTSSILASILHEAGSDPSFLIGGILGGFDSNFRLGHGRHFVVEGDEYDTAFFDKGPKFLHYCPEIAILTSIEFDHADIYADLASVKHSFHRLMEIMPSSGCLVANFDDPIVRDISTQAQCDVLRYGETPGLDWTFTELKIDAELTSFRVHKAGQFFGKFHSPMPGRHNALNTLAVIAVLDRLGFDQPTMAQALQNFQGSKRRQEIRGVVSGVTVIDDFAHHPTSVDETVAALRGKYLNKQLVVVFDPRTNSSRRSIFQEAFSRVFDHADVIIIREPEPLTTLSQEERFSAQKLVTDLQKRGLDARYGKNTVKILAELQGFAHSDTVIAILSNGGFDNIHPRLLSLLEES